MGTSTGNTTVLHLDLESEYKGGLDTTKRLLYTVNLHADFSPVLFFGMGDHLRLFGLFQTVYLVLPCMCLYMIHFK